MRTVEFRFRTLFRTFGHQWRKTGEEMQLPAFPDTAFPEGTAFAASRLGSRSMNRQRRTNPKAQSPRRDDSNPPAAPGRPQATQAEAPACVRLTRKYAAVIDGVDLTNADVGDRLDLSQRDADVLIAEGWAEPAPARKGPRRANDIRSMAADRSRPPKRSRK
jgi:hypothetical protein